MARRQTPSRSAPSSVAPSINAQRHHHPYLLDGSKAPSAMTDSGFTDDCGGGGDGRNSSGGSGGIKPAPSSQVAVTPSYSVTVRRRHGSLNMSIKGGREHGIPILLSKVFDQDQQEGGSGAVVQIGSEILSVNGRDMRQASHHEAVQALARAGDLVVLELRANAVRQQALVSNLPAAHDPAAYGLDLRRPRAQSDSASESSDASSRSRRSTDQPDPRPARRLPATPVRGARRHISGASSSSSDRRVRDTRSSADRQRRSDLRQFERPRAAEPPADEQQGDIRVVLPGTPTAAGGGDEYALPEPWVARLDPRTGRQFFANLETRQTSWQDPRSVCRRYHQDPERVDWSALPAGWERATDPDDGTVYFINHTAKATAWEPPRVAEQSAQHKVMKDVATEFRLELQNYEGMLHARREETARRQSQIERLSGRKRQLNADLRAPIASSSEQHRLEGQLQAVAEEVSAAITDVLQADGETESLQALVRDARARLSAVIQISKGLKAPRSCPASHSRALARRLQSAWLQACDHLGAARCRLMALEDQRRRYFQISGRGGFEEVVAGAAPPGLAIGAPHLAADGSLRTDLDMEIEALLFELAILPRLVEDKERLEALANELAGGLEAEQHGHGERDGLAARLSNEGFRAEARGCSEHGVPASFRDRVVLVCKPRQRRPMRVPVDGLEQQ